MHTCVVCGGGPHVPLPAVGPASMASDLRVIDAPLRKETCAGCGLVRTVGGATAVSFASGYELYAHAPGASAPERARQHRYADWIASLQPDRPASVLDAGCGNGSLLLALRDHWPEARLYGCDPSAESVRFGKAAGLELWPSAVAALPAAVRAALILTVNVVEHTVDPLAFFRELRARALPGGRLVVVCPDGARPDVELLIADHVHSFAPHHLAVLLGRAGWAASSFGTAPAPLGAFQVVVADAAADSDSAPALPPFDERLASRRQRFCERWAALDAALLARAGEAPLACFGTGETAGLLRAYAPRTWRRVYAYTADDIGPALEWEGVPVVPLADVAAGSTLLLAVRTQDQPAVAARLADRFARVIAWYDLVEA